MEIKTKQRLVGALVLLAILSIFLPVLFHTSRPVTESRLSVKVPPKPPKPAKPPKPKSHALKKKTGERGAIRRTLLPTPEAWVIRLGTFSNKANADRLLARLRHKGFDAYTRSLTTAQGKRLQRVYVGPEISLKNTKRLREKLQTTFHLNGVVSKYKI